MKRIVGILSIVLMLTLMSSAALASDRSDDVMRLQGAADVLSEVMGAPDSGIPAGVIGDAKCIAIVPSMKKAGFVFGGAYGKGVASCRTANGWSAPAFFAIKGGSFGFQIGAQEVDLVMLIMNDGGMRNLLASKFKLGADASVAAGPVGRQAEGATDWKMRAEVLTYSRARGVFAGITLSGAVVSEHQDDTRAFYGRMVPFKTILTGRIAAPADSEAWLNSLRKYAGAGVHKK